MSNTAIRVENLGKRYRLGQQVGYKTLRETLLVAYHTPTRVLGQRLLRMRHPPSAISHELSSDSHQLPATSHELSATSYDPNHIWALKDVSFEVKQGEAMGIIGRNGSGKSTLLKILSRITAPTEGYAEIHGRVGSLLEVGTGFHPELTGRENIHLNGAVLGMKKAEVDRKFDEIVAFAEIEKFLDTPVKRYSSGMYVRLAFAVAAHLEPEVLIVDEVLAVGDAEFQKKCLGKMDDVTKEGRTVLFVSHNIGAILNLCPSALWLDRGQSMMRGNSEWVVTQYLRPGSDKQGDAAVPPPLKPDDVTITKAFVLDSNHQISAEVDFRLPFFVGLEYVVRKPIRSLRVGVRLKNGQGIAVIFSEDAWGSSGVTDPGTHSAWVEIPGHLLSPGRYSLDLSAYLLRVHGYHYAHDCLAFDVCGTDSVDGREAGMGVICPELRWFRNSLD